MQTLRSLLLTALTLALVVTSLGMAMGRGAMAADGQLCSVTAPETIVLAHDGLPLLDANGDVVTLERPLCIDCLIGALAPAPEAPDAAQAAWRSTALHGSDQAAPVPAAWTLGPQARGPPPAA